MVARRRARLAVASTSLYALALSLSACAPMAVPAPEPVVRPPLRPPPYVGLRGGWKAPAMSPTNHVSCRRGCIA